MLGRSVAGRENFFNFSFQFDYFTISGIESKRLPETVKRVAWVVVLHHDECLLIVAAGNGLLNLSIRLIVVMSALQGLDGMVIVLGLGHLRGRFKVDLHHSCKNFRILRG